MHLFLRSNVVICSILYQVKTIVSFCCFARSAPRFCGYIPSFSIIRSSFSMFQERLHLLFQLIRMPFHFHQIYPGRWELCCWRFVILLQFIMNSFHLISALVSCKTFIILSITFICILFRNTNFLKSILEDLRKIVCKRN